MKPTKLLLLTLLILTASCRKDEPAAPEPERTHSIIYRVWCYNCNVEWTNELGQMQKIFMDGQYYDRPSKTLDIGPLDVRQGFNSTLKFSASENFTAGIVYFDIIDAHADTILFSERSKWFSPDKSLTIKWTAP